MEKAFKFRLYPNKKQIDLINKTFGCVRFVYNYYLVKREEMYKTQGITLNYVSCSKDLTQLKQANTWLKEVDKFALQNALKDLDKAFKNFFEGRAEYPKFKKKREGYQSYRTTFTNNNIEIRDSRIKLPKLGWVKFAKSRDIEGRILNAVISRTPTGKYFVSICCRIDDVKKLPKTDKVIGIDLGLKHFLVDSNGSKIEHPRYLIKLEKKLIREQRRFSRKEKGSNNYKKQLLRLAKVYEKIKNQREDFLHKLSSKIINENQVVILEDLKVKNMLRNNTLSKSISDSGWGKLIDMLEYKALWYGRTIVKLDTFYPSSQICSSCGYRNEKIKDLSVREWKCPECKTKHDRDINAAKNILKQGIKCLGLCIAINQ